MPGDAIAQGAEKIDARNFLEEGNAYVRQSSGCISTTILIIVKLEGCENGGSMAYTFFDLAASLANRVVRG